MKKQTTIIFSQLGEVQIQSLTSIVRETLALDYKHADSSKKFTAAELWNIQRQKKSTVQRRFIL